MRLILYYILHTFKNQLRKIFKTWVAVFIALCVLFGVVVGLGAAAIGNLADNSASSESSEVPGTEAMLTEDDENDRPTAEDIAGASGIVELAVGGVALLIFALHIFTGEKNGSDIFLLADVNFLFAAPLRPQSVLLFRLILQMGAMLAGSIYMLYQIPNLCLNLGLGIFSAVAIFGVWLFIIIYAKLFSVLVYTITSTKERLKKFVSPVMYGIIGVTAASFWLYYKSSGTDLLNAAYSFFNSKAAGYIPVWGWIKCASGAAVRSDVTQFLIYTAMLIAGIVLLSVIIWSIRADFYEDALVKSSQTAETIKKAAEGGMKTRKKERSEKIARNGKMKGSGASVYFYKTMYNRFRFASLKVFTKTSVTYLATAVIALFALKYIFRFENFIVVACVIGVIAFFRSLGNPISTDVAQASFIAVPESARKKVFYSCMGGTFNCLLDLIPAFAAAALMLGCNPLTALLMLFFIVSVDFYSSNVGAFLDISVPTSIALAVRNMIQIMFVYFGFIPVAGIIAVGFALGKVALFAVFALLFNLAVGSIFMMVTPVFIERGRR